MAEIAQKILKRTVYAFNAINLLCAVLEIIVGALGLQEVGKTSMKFDNVAAAAILIIAGAFAFIITVLGCYGSAHDSFGLLMAFCIGLVIAASAELVAIVLASILTSDAQKNLREDMERSMSDYNSNYHRKRFWDKVQKRHKCCGIEGFNDWLEQGNSMPESCWHKTIDHEAVVEHLLHSHKSLKRKGGGLYQNGCYIVFRNALLKASDLMMYVAVALCFWKFIGFILGCCLAFKVRGRF